MVKWIKALISGRKAIVNLNSFDSKCFTLKASVPQGAVLSPNLFTLYINDVVDVLGEEVGESLFADDLAIWVQQEDPDECTRRM